MGYDCLDCRQRVEIDKHGRCPKCGSDAIAPATGTNWQWKKKEAA